MKQLLPFILCSLFITSAHANNIEQQAVFAGGCFWCMEHAFDDVNGVSSTISGYIGGHKHNPTYKEVVTGRTGHTEAVKITFDSKEISYQDLLAIYWRNVDPTTLQGQFCDKGNQYRPEIFFYSAEQQQLAESSKAQLQKTVNFPIKVNITQASEFYPAEEYHQDFHHKNPIRYKFYRFNCGRDQRLDELWNDK